MEQEGRMMARQQTCFTCAHYGECADLHYCGGVRWTEDSYEDEAAEDRDECYDSHDDGPDPYDQWAHDSEVWQEQADRRW